MLTRSFLPSIGDTPPVMLACPYTLTATRDPLATDDVSAGWLPGSVWFNATAGFLRWWECRSNTAGAASWVFGGADYSSGGTNPSVEITQFGSGLGTFAEEGNAFRYPGPNANPASTNADIVMAAYVLPAKSFDVSGRGIVLNSIGAFANNTNVKDAKIIIGATTATVGSAVVGGTTIADTGAYSTASAVGWSLLAQVFKYGAAASNTQIAICTGIIIGNSHSGMTAPAALTLTESGAVNIAFTLNAATTATDATFSFAEVNALN
jgi:hypothetical protein